VRLKSYSDIVHYHQNRFKTRSTASQSENGRSLIDDDRIEVPSAMSDMSSGVGMDK
jgi:hypothetical protein